MKYCRSPDRARKISVIVRKYQHENQVCPKLRTYCYRTLKYGVLLYCVLRLWQDVLINKTQKATLK